MENFDLERVYDEQISPLMAQIIAICKEHKMPMLATFCFRAEDDGEQVGMCTTQTPFEGRTPDAMYRAIGAIAGNAGCFALTITREPICSATTESD